MQILWLEEQEFQVLVPSKINKFSLIQVRFHLCSHIFYWQIRLSFGWPKSLYCRCSRPSNKIRINTSGLIKGTSCSQLKQALKNNIYFIYFHPSYACSRNYELCMHLLKFILLQHKVKKIKLCSRWGAISLNLVLQKKLT